MKRKPIAQSKKQKILRQNNYACAYCGDPANEVEHIIPYAYVQNHKDDNLVAACSVCNQIGSDKVFDGFIEKQTFIREERIKKRWAEAIRLYRSLCAASDLPLVQPIEIEKPEKKPEKKPKIHRNIDGSSTRPKPSLPVPWKSQVKTDPDALGYRRKNDLQGDQPIIAARFKLLDVQAYQSAFLASYADLGSWRKVAEPYGIHANMARLIANGYQPGKKIRKILGLPEQRPATVCSSCGEIHTTKRCTARRRKYKDLFSIPTKELRAMIQNREEMDYD